MAAQKTNNYVHSGMASGRWFEFSLSEQMANIGSEVERYASWKKRGKEDLAMKAFERALELMNLSMKDEKYSGKARRREIGRIKETFIDTVHGAEQYGTPIEFFQKYFLDFGIVARRNK